jgi:hypothetical protein
MKHHDMKALKVVPFAHHKKIVLAENSSGNKQLYLNSGEMNRELTLLEGIGQGDIIDFSAAEFEKKTEEESKSETQKFTSLNLLVDSIEQKKQLESGELKAKLASRPTVANMFIEGFGKGGTAAVPQSKLMKEIDEAFSPITFEQTVTRIL